MVGMSAVIFLPDDTAKTGYPQPMMLQSVTGAPLLAWLANALFDSGVERFFLLCHDRYAQAARDCMPQHAEVTIAQDSDGADLLHVFLSTADDSESEVMIITGPAVYAPALAGTASGRSSSVRRANREMLMAALDESFSFSRFLREHGTELTESEGVFSADSPASLTELARIAQQDRMLRLQKRGVEIYDTNNCYIEPGVIVEEGAKLLPGTILRGRSVVETGAVIGPWSTIEDAHIGPGATVNASVVIGSKVGAEVSVGPFAHIRPDCTVSRGAYIGNFVELKNTRVGEESRLSHLSYAGDATIGDRTNLGCGTTTANFDRVEKHETVIGNDAFVGCNCALVAPVHIGDGAYLAAGSVITEDVPSQALGVARVRQTNKREWASRHKK